MQPDKIYLDLDGVLADFRRGMYDLCRLTLRDLPSDRKEADEVIWKAVREQEHYFDRLEPMPGALTMFRTLFGEYGDRVEILSAVPKPGYKVVTAEADKRSWVKRVLSPDVKVNIVQRKEKKDFAKGPGHILIDDFSENIDEWNAAGGTGIRFTSVVQAMSELEKFLE